MTIQFTKADVERFMSFVEILPNGCWFWAGGRSRGDGNKKWYGSFWLNGTAIRAHRFACEALANPPKPCPPEHDRDHICLFSLCVNPDHIDIVTKVVNQERKMERRKPRLLGETEVLVLKLAVESDGHLKFSTVYSVLSMNPDVAWRLLDGMRKHMILDHVAYDHWSITEKGKIALALANSKESI